MLRHAHFDAKGGVLPFAAVCTEVRCADLAAIRFSSTNVRNLLLI
jgi:hypothetical protein